MTIEELEILASYLHNESIESPFVNHPERKKWMAERIIYAIREDNYLLNQLLKCEDTDRVLDLIGGEYREKVEREENETGFSQTGVWE